MKTEELKTLKELEFDISNNRTFLMGVTSEELKAEAVKDINSIKKETDEFGEHEWIKLSDGTIINSIFDYIKWKNNLTEEDLQ